MAGALMNHSAYSADRATHLKIVVAALVASMLIVGFASYARFGALNGDPHATQAGTGSVDCFAPSNTTGPSYLSRGAIMG
jgi:hypothetical protein